MEMKTRHEERRGGVRRRLLDGVRQLRQLNAPFLGVEHECQELIRFSVTGKGLQQRDHLVEVYVKRDPRNYDRDETEATLADTQRTTRNGTTRTVRSCKRQETPSTIVRRVQRHFLARVCDDQPEQLLNA